MLAEIAAYFMMGLVARTWLLRQIYARPKPVATGTPDLVKAAIKGRLPRGIGVTRLRDAPVEWSRQTAMLGQIG